MTLFGHTCPHCGQDMPEQAATSFDAFWRDCPHKIGKVQAQKAWAKLTTANQDAAQGAVRRFYAWFRDKYPTASPLHPSTYLNNKRWLDLEPERQVNRDLIIQHHQQALNSPVPAVAEAARKALIEMGAA